MLREVIDMKLKKLLLQDNDVIDRTESTTLGVVMNSEFSNFTRHTDNEETYSLDISVSLQIVDSKIREEKLEIDETNTFVSFNCDYRVDFIYDGELSSDNKEIELLSEIAMFVEPFVRELSNSVFSKSEYPAPPIPLGILKKIEVE